MDFKKAQTFWDKKDEDSKHLEKEKLEKTIREFITSHNTLALATGAGDYVRCTPVEYTWYKDSFWIMSEGGKKFIGLEKNSNVALAVFDQYGGAGTLKGLQVMGICHIVEPLGKEYRDFLSYKKIPIQMIQKMEQPMPMLRIQPVSFDYLDSDLRKEGYSSRQHLSV